MGHPERTAYFKMLICKIDLLGNLRKAKETHAGIAEAPSITLATGSRSVKGGMG